MTNDELEAVSLEDAKRLAPEPRFWSKVDASGDCWVWTAGRRSAGYGSFYSYPKNGMAHRWLYEQVRGPIPPGLFVCHKCDNPPCVNPNHLFVGDHRANMRDCGSKGRHWTQRNPAKARGILRTVKRVKGEDCATALLTAQHVLEIRALWSIGTLTSELARRYDITGGQVRRIISREMWAHLPEPEIKTHPKARQALSAYRGEMKTVLGEASR